MIETLTLAPTRDPRVFCTAEGKQMTPPADWSRLPPGDAGLTRRVKAAGPTWTVVEKKGRKLFSHGVWAPVANITAARAALEQERATPQYAKKRAADVHRREEKQREYVGDFEQEVRAFLRFSKSYEPLEAVLAIAVTRHATPVGSGTVARTERIPIERRAEAAVIAWMRHQTTAYDSMTIDRIKGARREVRAQLAAISRAVLDLHRKDARHGVAQCPLCRLVPSVAGAESPAVVHSVG